MSKHSLEMDAVASRHADLLARSSARHHKPILFAIALIGYLVFCWWFFSIGQVLKNANWSLAGSYLADWVSYEVRPEFEVAPDGSMTLDYGRYSPLGRDPNPDWVRVKRETVQKDVPGAVAEKKPVARNSAFSFMASPSATTPTEESQTAQPMRQTQQEIITEAEVTVGRARLALSRNEVEIAQHGETLRVQLDGQDRAIPSDPLPSWATQRTEGGKIVLSFGLHGWAEIQGDEVSIRNRFFGWANFFFDTNSPFFGRPFTEVVGLITIGARLDPSQTNLSLAWNNILYNAEWQHLDVWTKLLQTIVMAFVGTLFASLLAFPLCFIAARNITRNRVLNHATKRLFDFLRSVDMLIWALFFTRAFGPGPLAGISAIFFTDTGTFGKLYSEALENIDDKPREGVKAVGAPPLAVQRFGVLPQVLPVFASQSLYFWESNTRSATIIGAVGAGGIGLKLWEAMRTNSDWENVAYMVLLILIVVFVFDGISNALRSRLMGTK